MRKLAFAAALLVALCSLGTAGAVSKPAKPEKPAKPAKATKQTAVQVATAAGTVSITVTDTAVSLTATGLTPGTAYAYTFQVWGEGNPYPVNLGGNNAGTSVRTDGTYTVSEDIADLRGYAAPYRVARVVVWLRAPGSPVGALAELAPDGTSLQAETRLP